ncbi:hypothetical protein ACFL20_11560 [Spirochaetota bacterium]
MKEINIIRNNWRYIIFLSILLGTLAALFLNKPIHQNIDYHNFADKRIFVQIPNFFDFFSNILFLILGITGLIHIIKNRQENANISWIFFFIGCALIAPGSAFYHWDPNNFTLIWDRFPMTIVFMSLFTALITEYINHNIEKYLLPLLLVLGLVSVIQWYLSQDLRLYIWVQLVPIITIPMILILFKNKYTHSYYLLLSFLIYLAAKLFEYFDKVIFNASENLISGHTIKHILASISIACIYIMLRIRMHRDNTEENLI